MQNTTKQMQNTTKLFKKTAFLCSKYILHEAGSFGQVFRAKTSDRSDYVTLTRGNNETYGIVVSYESKHDCGCGEAAEICIMVASHKL